MFANDMQLTASIFTTSFCCCSTAATEGCWWADVCCPKKIWKRFEGVLASASGQACCQGVACFQQGRAILVQGAQLQSTHSIGSSCWESTCLSLSLIVFWGMLCATLVSDNRIRRHDVDHLNEVIANVTQLTDCKRIVFHHSVKQRECVYGNVRETLTCSHCSRLEIACTQGQRYSKGLLPSEAADCS